MSPLIQVAIYGKTYCRAAKDTWHLVHSHGIQAIVNDNIIGTLARRFFTARGARV
jgi:hypothetical protein